MILAYSMIIILILNILQLIIAVLKVSEVIDWRWEWCLFPSWGLALAYALWNLFETLQTFLGEDDD